MPKILVTDDSAFMRELVMKSLKEAGYDDFIEADSGKKAITLFEKEKPDLVLLDIVMGPPLSGIDTLKEIMKADPEAKVVMVTVVDQPKVTEEAEKLGATNYITKPVDPQKLVDAVKKALE